MELIDLRFTQAPTYGVRRMREYLQKETGNITKEGQKAHEEDEPQVSVSKAKDNVE